MKKKISAACILLIVSAAGIVYYQTRHRSRMSDIALANIEALSQNESGSVLRLDCEYEEFRLCFYDCPVCSRTHRTEYINHRTIKAYGYCVCGVRIYDEL